MNDNLSVCYLGFSVVLLVVGVVCAIVQYKSWKRMERALEERRKILIEWAELQSMIADRSHRDASMSPSRFDSERLR